MTPCQGNGECCDRPEFDRALFPCTDTARPYMRVGGKDYDLTEPLAMAAEIHRLRTMAGRMAKAVIERIGAIKWCRCCSAQVFDPLDELTVAHHAGCPVTEWRREGK